MKVERRRYELRKRAETQDETRQRIVESAVALHERVGPAQTSISSIADHAGVSRPTVYRHFPDERAVFTACTHHYLAKHPPPDPADWEAVLDPLERMRHGLREVYAWFAETEAMQASTVRDLPRVPELGEVLVPQLASFNTAADVLAAPFPNAADPLLNAAIGHALTFSTWQSLVRNQELREDDAVALMVGMVESAVTAQSLL